MRKVGKYEKMRKRALLQTYFTSLLCLALCVTMFLGTSYAWFTSEVNNPNNEIYIGTLDVELEKKLPDGTWSSLSEMENNVNKTNLFDKNIRWEPGFTALETVKVVNEGDLAFKYVLNFTDGKLAESSEKSIDAVAKQFDVWVYKHSSVAPDAESYADINEENGWKKAGSLDQLLAGEPVLEGVMDDVRYEQITENTEETVPTNEGTTDGIPSEATYTIALHMKEDTTAQDTLMGQKISLTVKLVAYQMNSEADAFDNTYDNQLVATAEQLKTALESGESVVLISDISLTDAITIPSDATVTLDLNGHTLTTINTAAEASCAIGNKGELAICNGTVTYKGVGDSSNGYGTNTITNSGKLVIDGATIINTTDVGSSNAIDNAPGSTLVVNSGTIKSEKVTIRVRDGADVTINGGEISGSRAVQVHLFQGVDASTKLTITGGTFTGAELALYSYAYSSVKFDKTTINISGGTFNGNVAFGGGNKQATETVNITGGTFNGNLGRYLTNDGWEDIAKP